MKKKFWLTFFAVLTSLCMALSLAGCSLSDLFGGSGGSGSKNPSASHVHSYGEWKVTKEATCTEEGIKERECSCGEKESVTYRSGHDFVNMTCKYCGMQASLGLSYSLMDKWYCVSGIGTCTDTDLVITNNYNGKPVTRIGFNAFKNCSGLTSVIIPDSVTSIGDYAFYGCSGLTSVTIGSGVTEIDIDAFFGCTRLASVIIPDSVTSIESSAFANTAYYNDDSYWTDDVLYIGNHLIRAKSTISGNYIVRDGTKTIIDDAFYLCTGLTSVIIPDSVTGIGWEAFRYCSGLTSIDIPDSVTRIDNGAFENCSGLESVTIGSGVTSIDDTSFSYCSSLAKITVDENNPTYHAQGNCLIETKRKTLIGGCKTSEIPDDGSVTKIGYGAFEGCSGLTEITIPNSVTEIKSSAFKHCSGLTEITIPNSVTEIDSYAFDYCSGLESVIWNAENCTHAGSYNYFLFASCTNLSNVTFGSNVQSIPEYAFARCSGLTEIKIPDSVTEIGDGAFAWCSRLTSITIGSGVTSIGGISFSYCSSLVKITVDENNPTYHAQGNCLIETESKTLILGCKTSEIPDDGSVTKIGYGAFRDCRGLTKITIPGSVTEIEGYAFNGCSGLTEITIPNSVTEIDSYAFNGCSGLKEAYFENPNGWGVSGLEDPETAAQFLQKQSVKRRS